MKQNNWQGIMKIKEIQHWDSNNNLLWESHNVKNLLHFEGEQFLLQAAFSGGKLSTIIPEFYYLGLDNRLEVSVEDTMQDILNEPNKNGYQRASVASSGDFAINFINNHYVATSPVVAFFANLGFWGPVSNLFITAEVNNEYKLISTVVLPSAIEVNSGERITLRIGMQLRDCPQD
jgi:hypothetical protein